MKTQPLLHQPNPDPGLNRRSFLRRTAAAVAGLGLAPLAGCNTLQSSMRRGYKISLAEWSLHRALFAKQMDHLDFPKVARQDYGIEAIELVNQFFKDKARNRSYLTELKNRAGGEGVQVLLIMVDGEGALGDPDTTKRHQAVENHHKWIEAAHYLGCHSIRVNAATGNTGTPAEQGERAIDGLRRLAEVAAPYALNVIVENHGGLSSNAAWLVEVMRGVNLPNCGALPDFGNFDLGNGQTYDRYLGVAQMMPWARAVSAKSYDFDDAGWEVNIDYRRMMRIVLAGRYHEHVGIEYEGDRMSEPEGIRATKRLLERVRIELAGGQTES